MSFWEYLATRHQQLLMDVEGEDPHEVAMD